MSDCANFIKTEETTCIDLLEPGVKYKKQCMECQKFNRPYAGYVCFGQREPDPIAERIIWNYRHIKCDSADQYRRVMEILAEYGFAWRTGEPLLPASMPMKAKLPVYICRKGDKHPRDSKELKGCISWTDSKPCVEDIIEFDQYVALISEEKERKVKEV